MVAGWPASGAAGQSEQIQEESPPGDEKILDDAETLSRGEGRRAGSQPCLTAPILVLVNPQDIVNIASAVRIAKNFGIEQVRLVNPEVFDPYRIEGIAHNTADLVARIEIVNSLQEAIADCGFTAVLTARERAAKRRVLRPREAAAELV